MSELPSNPTTLDEKLQCAFAELGTQFGEVMRCMIESEVSMHLRRIEELQLSLKGLNCNDRTTSPTPGSP